MADVLNLKINERSNVEQSNLRESLKQEIKIGKMYLYQRENMRINKMANSAEYQIKEEFQDLPIFEAKF